MAQQVNLCLPVLRKQSARLSAQSLALVLGACVVVGGALSASWLYSLGQASTLLKTQLDAQTRELDALRTAIEQRSKSDGPAQQALAQDIKNRKQTLQQREAVLAALSQGLFEPGRGHAARLHLVAQSIPEQAWITQVRADAQLLEVSGFTLDPEALNAWVGRLAASDLLAGQRLSTVKVESVKPDAPALLPAAAPVSAASAMRAAAPVAAPRWSYTLLSSVAAPIGKTGSVP